MFFITSSSPLVSAVTPDTDIKMELEKGVLGVTPEKEKGQKELLIHYADLIKSLSAQ